MRSYRVAMFPAWSKNQLTKWSHKRPAPMESKRAKMSKPQNIGVAKSRATISSVG